MCFVFLDFLIVIDSDFPFYMFVNISGKRIIGLSPLGM